MTRRLIRRKTGRAPADGSLLNRLYAARGVRDHRELDLSLGRLRAPESFKDLDEAAALLADTVARNERILIIGDFDADGATSTAMMVQGLRAMGASNVDYLVPNRFEYGYGLTPEIVRVASAIAPSLLVTVDNGMSSVDGVALARSFGMRVLITDHHLPGEVLPDADAVVNPNRTDCAFPAKSLSGVGVAFYVLSAFRSELRARNWFAGRGSKEPNLAGYLDLVALGTVADLVPLDHNNRILVQAGISRIRAGRSRAGIRALVEVSGGNPAKIVSRDLAFGVAPRLNAAGRLDDMSLGIECLLADDEKRARELARRLDELNRERRSIEDEMREQARVHLEASEHLLADKTPVGVCLYDESWHQGVVGIVASRIKDQLHRPVIAFAPSSGDELKGSGRSVNGLHIRDALDAVAAKNPGLVVKFGGHAMAAGLSIRPENLERFASEFDEEARRWLDAEDLEHVLVSDGEIGEDVTLSLTRQVIEAGPWGQGFPEPVFDGVFEVLDQRIVRERHLKMKLRPIDSVQSLDAIAFNRDSLLERREVRLAYRLDVNEYRGLETVQLIVEALDLEP